MGVRRRDAVSCQLCQGYGGGANIIAYCPIGERCNPVEPNSVSVRTGPGTIPPVTTLRAWIFADISIGMGRDTMG